MNESLENEEITSFELGYGYRSRNLTVNVNAYSTTWGNRFVSNSFDYLLNDTTEIEDAILQGSGVDVIHSGI